MYYLRILGMLFMISGAGLNYLSKYLVTKLKLDVKANCDFYGELDESEISEYKFNKASLNIKVISMFVLLPGIFMLLYSYS